MKRLLIILLTISTGSLYAQAPATPPAAKPATPPAAPATTPAAQPAPSADLASLLEKGQRSADSLSPAEISRLLELARDAGTPYSASVIIKAYLAKHADASPSLIRLAAENASLTLDHRNAIARYKQFLKTAQNGPEASDAAAALYDVLLMTGQDDEAFSMMQEYGDKFRQTAASRRADRWFLQRCTRNNNNDLLEPMGRRLATIMAEKLPIEQERELCWDYLGWYLDRMNKRETPQQEILTEAQKLQPLIRESAARSAWLKFMVKNGIFRQNVDRKDGPTQEREIGEAIAAAKEYMDASPSAWALQNIIALFSGGWENANDQIWNQQAGRKQEFIGKYAFDKMNEEQRRSFLNWNWWIMPQRSMSRELWNDAVTRQGATFKTCKGNFDLPLFAVVPDPAVYKAQAPNVAGMLCRDASLISAMAAGNNVQESIRHFVERESWYLDFSRQNWGQWSEPITEAVMDQIPAAWNAKAKDDNAMQKARLAFADQHIFGGPMALFCHEATRRALSLAWDHASTSPDDKSKMITYLQKLDWVPYSKDDRRKIIQPLFDHFRNWSQESRKAYEEAKKNNKLSTPEGKGLEARIAVLGPLEDAFKAALNPAVIDPAKAPTPLCKELAKAVVASQAKDEAGYLAAVKAIYPMVREYEINRTPFGEAILGFVTRHRDGINTYDFQKEVLVDQLNLYVTKGYKRGVVATVDSIGSRPGWRIEWGWALRVPDQHRKDMSEIFAKALQDLLAKNQFDPQIFNWYRGFWQDEPNAAGIMKAMIEKKILFSFPQIRSDHSSATASYMHMLRSWFRSLDGQFPTENWFDGYAVEEMKKTGNIDLAYWRYGRDENGKVSAAAGEILAQYTTAPMGYNDTHARFSRDDFFEVQMKVAGGAGRSVMLPKVEAAYGTTRFDEIAAGRISLSSMPVDKPEQRAAFFQKLNEYVNRAASAPFSMAIPSIMGQLDRIKASDLTKDELMTLKKCISVCSYPQWMNWERMDRLVLSLHEGFLSQGKTNELFSIIPRFWLIARVQNDQQLTQTLSGFPTALMEAGRSELAAAYSMAGLDFASHRMTEEARNALLAVRNKALGMMGGGLMVPRSDRRYPILAAQMAFRTDKKESAWGQYLTAKELALTEYKDLDLSFLTWLIEHHTELGEYEDAEKLAKTCIQWVDSAAQGYDPDSRAALQIAMADISLARQEYPRAKALYERIAVAKEYEKTRGAGMAELKIAEVERLTRHYDEALTRLEKLEKWPDPFLRAEGMYHVAVVKFQQEDFAGAQDALKNVLQMAPGHANARILESELNRKMKKYDVATQVEGIGILDAQKTVVPGKPIKVRLEDPNLAMVGKSMLIEVRMWTDAGDEETFNLVPFADSRTRFEGSLPTVLAAAKKGDRVLQLLGKDRVMFGFSENFKKNAGLKADIPSVPIEVVSAGELYVSSGRILTKEEQEERALERMIMAKMPKKENEVALSSIRSDDEIKPGNPVYIRVIDADRSVTTEKDTLTVRATTLSGDVVDKIVLKETDTHTGIFEGKIETTSAPATAFASDTEEGREANYAIARGTYPAWIGLADNRRPKTFSVDLNDNVALGKMTILADEPSRLLKNFVVETSQNGRTFTPVAMWPGNMSAWDGSLRLRVARYEDKNGLNRPVEDLRGYFDFWHQAAKQEVVSMAAKPTIKLKEIMKVANDRIRPDMNNEGSPMVVHIDGMFFVPQKEVRTLVLEGLKESKLSCVLAIDGIKANTQSGVDISMPLGKGLHRLDIFLAVRPRTENEFEIHCDTTEPPYMARCPDSMFSPSGWPVVYRKAVFQPAKIAVAEGNKSFDVTFTSNTMARVIRLGLVDFETDAPAIRKISLSSADGKAVLPPAQDILMLKTNQTLEIVPGDRLTIAYEDPSGLQKEKKTLEAFLRATFFNGTLRACLIESGLDPQGNRQAKYIPIRRFRVGDSISVFISDADLDNTDALDKTTFKVKTTSGKTAEVEAMETEKHSGLFIGKVFTVAGAPQRPSEITVEEDDDLFMSYVDAENTEYGVPWIRTCDLEQASGSKPQLRVYDFASFPLGTNEIRIANKDFESPTEEYFPIIRSVVATRPIYPATDRCATGMLGCPLIVEVRDPGIAMSALSTARIYVQTTESRRQAGMAPTNAFDINMPGTIKLETSPCGAGGVSAPSIGYKGTVQVQGSKSSMDPLDEGLFTFYLPVRIGEVAAADPSGMGEESSDDGTESEHVGMVSFLDGKGIQGGYMRKFPRPTLWIYPDDEVFVAMEMAAASNKPPRLVVQRVKFTGDSFFDVMEKSYRKKVPNAHIGETLYLRVADLRGDVSPQKDAVKVTLAPVGGTNTQTVTLMETFEHSGVFKGSVVLGFAATATNAPPPGVNMVALNYGQNLKVSFTSLDKQTTLAHVIPTFKGADGEVMPFTKRFQDMEIAVQTQFTTAEAYFELAKKHRELKEEETARREIAQGKKLLEEVIRDFPETQARAQADYLLANLALESGEQTKDETLKKRQYVEAVNRFDDLVKTFPDSPYAPKAQFKKALAYERMGQIDQSCEEYVKLSYRYPDNELVAETIARLGQYFMKKGKDLEDKAAAEANLVQKQKLQIQAKDFFKTSAQVFSRLAGRFPDHGLAQKTQVLSAQCWMRADDLVRAISTFKKVLDGKKAEPDLMAEAMYWCGDCYMRDKKGEDSLINAYRMFKKLTWDYPETVWAKYARGRLTEKEFANVEEMEAEEEE